MGLFLDEPTIVVNLRSISQRQYAKIREREVYIGRPSKWGNPFVVGRDGTREECIEKFRAYLLTNSALLEALPELEGKVLSCFCKPLACHGDVIVEILSLRKKR